MTVYAVGDIQGCYDALLKLLDKVDFDPDRDELWSTGDIVNRGPGSLATIRFLHQLGDRFRMVLGNHDLHLLAVYHGVRSPLPKDTLDEILEAPDCAMLLDWLQKQPLLVQDAGYVLVHAGIPPQWSLTQARQYAGEVEAVLRDERAQTFFANMYGNQPDCWSEDLEHIDRWRLITNYLTRMRFCDAEGKLELQTKGSPENPPPGFIPWFRHSGRKTRDKRIIFGHWAALEGKDCGENLHPLDTGYVWGRQLRLMRLDTGDYTEVE